MVINIKLTKTRLDTIFFAIGFIVFPIVIFVSLYSIFSVKNDTPIPVSSPVSHISVGISEVPRKDEPVSAPVANIDTQDYPGPMTSSISTVRTGLSDSGIKKSEQNQESITQTGIWTATQYTQGDIIKNTYVVQLGDTLWQIANGYYGNAEDWTKILEANKDSIGFLPDGQQALITPGQILTLP